MEEFYLRVSGCRVPHLQYYLRICHSVNYLIDELFIEWSFVNSGLHMALADDISIPRVARQKQTNEVVDVVIDQR